MKPTLLFFLSLALMLSSFCLASPARASGAAGSRAFVSRGCVKCHSVERPREALTREGELSKKGPDLWYAGSKFKDGFLASWLAAPAPIRPLAYNSLEEKNKGDHPALEAAEARAVASYLMGLKATDLVAPVGIRPAANVRGRVVFSKKFACYGCHLVGVRDESVGGLSGPSLEHTRERLNPDWIYALLTSQSAFAPVSRMPVYKGLASDADMKALASYVAAFE
ncbi:MAG: c-type cytochrome [Thermodesulfobacteriota bacterium]